MLKAFADIAEERIRQSMENGDFYNLEGQGKPLSYDDDSMVPEDLRMAYKILKNSGHAPPEIQEEKEIITMMDLLSNCQDERERYRQIQKLNIMITQFNIRYGRAVNFEKDQVYYEKIIQKVPIIKHR
ncbi:DnaJ family domain-containing protein [Desulfovibrio inopinatus]|uniref:DnaJ family domain-containing protein n=1 Tax=Desulfovibrio inopinatus TaxID=102109 RepID=UPI0003F97828|nr:DnaJ family domain-containing protein [Desulfovibrio inopinatus]